MKYLLYLVVIVLIIGFSFGVLAPLGLGWLIPALPLLLVLSIVVEYGNLDYVFFALMMGIWMDVLYGMPIGSFSGAYLISGAVSYLLFQRLVWADAGLKYYVGLVLSAELFLLLWLWLYTMVLVKLRWIPLGIAGGQLWHHSWKIILVSLVFAFPVYLGVNIAVRWWGNFRRRPLQLS